MSIAEPSAFLELVSIDAGTGAVTALGPVLIDNVLECAMAVDDASGSLVYAFTGPLEMTAVGSVTLTKNSPVQPFNVLLSTVGAVMALTTLPAGSPGVANASYPGPSVLLLTVDGQGSIGGLQVLDPVSGTVSTLITTDERVVNPSQGALLYDATTQSAYALAQYVSETQGQVDILVTFDLARRSYSYVSLNDSAVAPMGLWGFAAVKSE